MSFIKIIGFCSLAIIEGCINPFAPSLEDQVGKQSLISDQETVDGVFQNFQYAYTFSDTTIYGKILSSDFIFSYRDYDKGIDVSWGRDEEMNTTWGLFNNTQRLDLVWNKILSITEDSTGVVRGFNLTITFNPTDVIFIDGRVNLTLEKSSKIWKISRWIDESNF